MSEHEAGKKRTRDHFWQEPIQMTQKFQRAVLRALDEIADEIERPRGTGFTPVTEVVEEDDAIRVYIDLPGVRKEDIELTLEKDRLIVAGERKAPTDEKKSRPGNYGRFEKRIQMPAEIELEGHDATLADGVLTVTIPRKAKAPGVKINVK